MNALPLIILAVLVLGMLFFAQRNRQKAAAAEVQRRATIGVGTDVMTTAGLYGTVTAIDAEDDTVLLSIAPGVEVKFAFAALRDVASLPTQYRAGTSPYPENGGDESATAAPTEPDQARPERPAPERPDA